MRVLEVTRDETFADQLHVLQLIRCFGDESLDLFRLRYVDRDNASARRREVGLKPKDVAVAAEKIVRRVLFVQKLYHGRVRFLEVLVKDPDLPTAPCRACGNRVCENNSPA